MDSCNADPDPTTRLRERDSKILVLEPSRQNSAAIVES